MADYLWYKTTVSTSGEALTDSVAVTVWFGAEPPPPGSGTYDLVIIDSDGDGLISESEWKDATGSGAGGNRGGSFALFDFTPPQTGNLYTAVPYSAGDTGLLDGLTQTFTPVDPDFLVICFAAGTLIDTPAGPRPVETLAAGDPVLTLDHGPQPVRSVWRGDRPGIGPYTPVRIAAGVLGATRDVLVSRNHRVLVRHPQVELLFGFPEALVMAKSLASGTAVRAEPRPAVTYVHLFLDRHEIVMADGVPCETFFPGSHLTPPDAALFCSPTWSDPAVACRPMLSHSEGRLLATRILPGHPSEAGQEIPRAAPALTE
jgi:hypothetical protein